MLMRILIAGTSPLLMNRMSPEQVAKLHSKEKDAKNAQRLDAQQEAATKVYVLPDEHGVMQPVMPIENLLSCLIEAGKHIRLDGKKQISNATSTVLPAMLFIPQPQVLWLRDPDPGKPQEAWGVAQWRYDLRAGKNPNGGQAVAIVRPMFQRWAFELTADLETNELALAKFRQLFDVAGSRIGLCDFRPQRKGFFGQFRVDRWEAVATEEEKIAAK